LPTELNYQGLEAHRKEWLNLIEVDDFLKEITPPVARRARGPCAAQERNDDSRV